MSLQLRISSVGDLLFFFFKRVRRPPRSPPFPSTPLSLSRLCFPPLKLSPATSSSTMMPSTTDRFRDRKSTRLNSSHANISYAVFCLKKTNIFSLSLPHARPPYGLTILFDLRYRLSYASFR